MDSVFGSFRDDVKYGLSFPCCCCQTLNFRSNMVKESTVEELQTPEARMKYLDVELMDNTGSLFMMLDTTWICKDCKKAVGKGKMPTLCAKNGLRATWRDLPNELLELNMEELDALALSNIFMVFHGLSSGVDKSVSSFPKTLLLPLSNPSNAEGRTRSLPDAVQWLHKGPLEEKTALRPKKVLEADAHLLIHEKAKYAGYRDVLRKWCQIHVAREMSDQDDNREGLDNALGKRSTGVFVTVLPDLCDLEEINQILNIGPLDERTRHIYDLSGESGLGVDREETISGKQWLVHRLRSVFRSGPSNDPSLILALLIKFEASRLLQLKRILADDRLKSALRSVPGQKEFLAHKADNLQAMAMNLGPATFSFSVTLNTSSEHHLACFVSQRRYMEEYSRLQVWDHREEKELLILRPGYGLESVEDTYFVHEKTEVADDNCMFHNFCRRSPLENYGRW